MARTSTRDLWLFAYGSLMWRPGFDYLEARPALLRGYHRALCIYSHIYRGSRERPGLVLGLDLGGSCRGIVFRVAAARAQAVLADVDAREIIYDVYVRRLVPVQLVDKGEASRIMAYTYISDRSGPQYAGKLPRERMIELVQQGQGQMGRSLDYLKSTVQHLEEMGVPDRNLRALLHAARAAG